MTTTPQKRRPKRSVSISKARFDALAAKLPKTVLGHVRGRHWDRAINAALDAEEAPPLTN